MNNFRDVKERLSNNLQDINRLQTQYLKIQKRVYAQLKRVKEQEKNVRQILPPIEEIDKQLTEALNSQNIQDKEQIIHNKNAFVLSLKEKLSMPYILSEKELKRIMNSRSPEVELAAFLDNDAWGNVAYTRDLLNILGFNVDLGVWSIEETEDNPLARGWSVLVRKEGNRWHSVSKAELVKRSQEKEIGSEQKEDWDEYRIVFFESLGINPKGELYIVYSGYADLSLEDGGKIYAHSIHIRDDFAEKFFVEAKGSLISLSKSTTELIYWKEADVLRHIPANVSVDEQYYSTEFAFGYHTQDGKELKLFVRWIKDTSDYFGYEKTLPGAAARLPLGRNLSIEAEVTTETYKIGTRVNLPRGVKLNVSRDENDLYGTTYWRISLDVPLPELR